MRTRPAVALAALLLAPLLASCGSNEEPAADTEDEVEAGSWTADPSVTGQDWDYTFVGDLAGLNDGAYDEHSDEELIAAGHAACDTLEYDYSSGDFSHGRAALAAVEKMLGEGETVSWRLVQNASDRLCDWSHIADTPPDFPLLSEFTD